MIGAVTVERSFFTTKHLLVIREGRRDGQKMQDYANEAKLKGIVKDRRATDRRLILRANNIGSV